MVIFENRNKLTVVMIQIKIFAIVVKGVIHSTEDRVAFNPSFEII